MLYELGAEGYAEALRDRSRAQGEVATSGRLVRPATTRSELALRLV